MKANPVSIAETIVHGVAFDPKNSERVARMDLNELFASVGCLFDLLDEREIDYVLAGGIAMRSYVAGRNTQDVDLIFASANLDRIPELRVEDRNDLFAKCWLGDLRIDLRFLENEPFASVAEAFVTQRRFADRLVPCATEDGLLLMKLHALPSLYRQAQLRKVRVYEGDVADLLELPETSAERVWANLEANLLDSDVAELRAIVAEIKQKISERGQRFNNGGGV